MRNLYHTDIEALPLFAAAAARHRHREAQQAPFSARWVQRRFHHLSGSTARLIAEQAGLSVEV
jgi:hypothetical protein